MKFLLFNENSNTYEIGDFCVDDYFDFELILWLLGAWGFGKCILDVGWMCIFVGQKEDSDMQIITYTPKSPKPGYMLWQRDMKLAEKNRIKVANQLVLLW